MNKNKLTVTISLAALSLALLFLLAACGTAAGSSSPATPPAVSTVEEVTTSPVAMPNTAGGFDCAPVNQIPFAECTALVALYNSTGGPDWADNSGWLATNTPCTWLGIDCAGGHVSHIHLLYNQLTGTLPSELGNLSHLRVLALWANQLQGSMPAELGNLSELIYLDLSGNRLTGPLPAELGNLTKLQTLSLVHNQFSGPIPPLLGAMESLESLDLSYNQFSGAIPAELGNLGNLSGLRLSHNQLSGPIPVTLGNLILDVLDLSYNQLSGSIPDSFTRNPNRTLWGNRLDGTISGSSQEPLVVDYKGIHFSADSSLAISIWPEVIPATSALEDDPFWYVAPEHLRFTFANPYLLPGRTQMGLNLAVEAQILIYPLAELAAIDPSVATQIATLQGLLAERGPVPAGDLPLLPVTNAAQVFHTQIQYLESSHVQGLRFLTEHSQEARPIVSQNLFYTFQGFTNDGNYYVAAFFPLTTANLPDKVEVADWETFSLNYAAYLLETTEMLDQLTPAEFTPDLALLDAVVTSLRVEPGNASSSLPLVAPPAGLVYRASDGLWRLGAGGRPQLLTERADALPAPDAAHAVYMDNEDQLWLIDLADGSERPFAQGVHLSRFYQWGDAHTLLLGVWLTPAESEGAAAGHMATLDIDSGKLQVINEKYLSLGRPALAPDGQTVAYDLSPFHADVALTGYLYHPDGGSSPIDPALFNGLGDERPWHLYNPAWSPDGRQLAWLWGAEAGSRLVRFDLDGQKATTLLTWQPAGFAALPPAPLWSPDGQWLAIEVWASNEAESGLWLVAADGSDARRISAASSSFAVGSGLIWLSSHELVYVACDDNYNNCENRLFDLASETTMLLDLPPDSIVLLAPPVEIEI